METSTLPRCQSCNSGDLVPLSDFGGQGAAIHYKAWACTNPECGFNIKIRNGDIYLNEPITNGSMYTPRDKRQQIRSFLSRVDLTLRTDRGRVMSRVGVKPPPLPLRIDSRYAILKEWFISPRNYGG